VNVLEQGAEGIFGPKRKEVVGSWRRLHNEVHHNLYCSPRSNLRMGRSCSMHRSY
jgi:hypothetical protein